MTSGVYERTSEHCAAIARAKKGVKRKPFTPEHCAAISAATTGENHPMYGKHHSEEASETMRGGNDICKHHYIYDHFDLSKNTVEITRSDHMKLHRLLQKLGYKVPHINMVKE